jgi:hypothetical protein
VAELIDYSYARFSPAEIKAAGLAGVIRYVSSGRPQVSATRAEVDGIRAAGLAFCAVWERDPSRALLGRAAGLLDGADAYAYCAGLGATITDPVYFAVDFDATPAQMPAVAAYVEGAASVLGWNRVGVYGGLPVLAYLRDRTPLALFWQTIAWSGGQVAPYANLLQYVIEDRLNGKAVDLDRSLTVNYGQWGVPMPITYPGCRWYPLGAQTENRQTTHNVIILHTMVGYLVSTDNLFRAGNGAGFIGLESHFGVGGQWGPDLGGSLDGAIWQWQDLDYQAQASGEGNWRAISIETADNAPQRPEDIAAWTPAQVDAIVDLVAWLCRRYDIPARLVPDTRPGSSGIAYHAQGTAVTLSAGAERWSPTAGKPCPTARRIAQITGTVIPRVQQLLNQEEDASMSAADADRVIAAVNEARDVLYNLARAQTPDGKPDPGHAEMAVTTVNARLSAIGKAVGAIGTQIGALADDEAKLLAATDAATVKILSAVQTVIVDPQVPNSDPDAFVAALRDALVRGEPPA